MSKDKKRLEKIQQVREVKAADLNKNLKQPAPSVLKRQAEAKARAANREPLTKELKSALKKFGGTADKVTKSHSEYYTARGAEALLRLKADPKKTHKTKNLTEKITFANLKNGRFLVERDGIADHKTKTWKQIKNLQKKLNREEKYKLIAGRIGSTSDEVRKIVKTIEKSEAAKVRRYKKSKAYKKLKSKEKRKITIARRVNAIFGAMTDLLSIYGSPKALQENADEAQWKKFGDTWAVKSNGKWLQKIGPDEWQQIRVRKSKGRKRK